MRSADLRRRRLVRLHAEPARMGATALLRARGIARRSARAIQAFVIVTNAGLAARAGYVELPTTPNRREPRLRG